MENMQILPVEMAKKIKRIIMTKDYDAINKALESGTNYLLAGVTVRYGEYWFLVFEIEN